MSEFSITRRNILTSAGVGVASLSLGACYGEKNQESRKSDLGSKLSPSEVSMRVSDFMEDRGIPNSHGDNPNLPRPEPSGTPTPPPGAPFKPDYMALIHLSSNGPWDLSSNHAHFKFAFDEKDPNHTENRIKMASEIFLNKLNPRLKRFKEENRKPKPTNEFLVYDRNPSLPNDYADEVAFDRFRFGSQHDLYIFFEHKKDEVTFDLAGNRIIMFSTHHNNGMPADQNGAFFSAKIINEKSLLGDLDGKGSLIRLENHFTVFDLNTYKKIGSEPKLPTNQHYKMDIIFINSSGVVMAIDPDTGNGTSWQP